MGGEELLELEQPGGPQLGGRRQPGAVDRTVPCRGGRRLGFRRRWRILFAADRPLHAAHTPCLGHRQAGQLLLLGPIGGTEQGPRMARRQLPVGQIRLDRGRQAEQSDAVGDRRTALAHPAGQLVVGQLEVLQQLLVGGSLLQRGEVLPVEILDEFDPRLESFSASAIVSIHADSCDYINELATGFKISGSPLTDSSSLSICIEQAYREATELKYHPDSITPHMTDYHAFRKIAPGTPAIIIEVGFLNLDREILTSGSEVVVSGLSNGILCYMDQLP